MRALVVHPGVDFSVADVHNGWCDGLRTLGWDVREYNLHDRLAFYSAAHLERDGEWVQAFSFESSCQMAAQQIKSACYEWWPDLVILISDFFVDQRLVEIIKSRGHKVAVVFTESPYEDTKQLERLDGIDCAVINDPLNLDLYREVVPASFYAPHCYRPEIHHPGPASPDVVSEACFVGTGMPSRVEFLEQVDWTGIELLLAGAWKDLSPESPLRPHLLYEDSRWCVMNDHTATIYRSSLTSFNVYRIENNEGVHDRADGIAMGPREVELAACGLWFARQSRPEGDDLLPMLPIFSTPEEMGEQIRWAIAHPDERQEAATAARAALSDRTFDNNVRALMTALGL